MTAYKGVTSVASNLATVAARIRGELRVGGRVARTIWPQKAPDGG